MDLTQLLAWIVGANTIITFATTVYNLMSTRATRALKAIESLEAKIAKLAEDRQTAGEVIVTRFQLVETRLLKIEGDIEHMPDRNQAEEAQKQAHRLELAIEKLSGSLETLDQKLTGRMDTLDERLKPVVATTARLQNYLMEQGVEK
jgi:hypothetical protein